MQIFMSSPVILSWLRTHVQRRKEHSDCPQPAPNRPQRCIACILHRLATAYWKPDPQTSFDTTVRAFDVTFINHLWPQLNTLQSAYDLRNEQQDAQEFLLFLLHAMNMDGASGEPTKPMNQALYNTLFTLHTQTHWLCPRCGKANGPRDQRENGRIIETSAGTDRSIQQFFTASFQDKKQDGLQCDHCHEKKLTAIRYERIVAAPAMMFVVLRFFRYKNGRAYKVDPRAKLSPTIDISKHLRYQQDDVKSRYQLRHVVHHIGRTIESGHYFGRYTCPTGQFEIEDDDVTPNRPVHQYKEGSSTPYILLYERIDDDNVS